MENLFTIACISIVLFSASSLFAEDIHTAMYDEAYENLPSSQPKIDVNTLPATAAGEPKELQDCDD